MMSPGADIRQDQWNDDTLLTSAERPGIATVPAEHSLTIDLTAMPRTARQLRREIALAAPLLPKDLAWTPPTIGPAGQVQTIVARRRWLDDFVGNLERHRGRYLDACSEVAGHRFDYRSPEATRQIRTTLAVWGASLAVILISSAVIAHRDASIPPGQGMERRESGIVEPAFRRPTLAASLMALPPGLTDNRTLAAIERERGGALIVELLAPDPDALRDDIATRGGLPGYREAGQTRDARGGYRVRYESAAPGVGSAGRTALPITAIDAADAAAQAQQTLAAYAAARAVEMRLSAQTLRADGVTELDANFAGPQSDVLALADQIESGAVPMRIAKWTLTPGPSGVQLAASVIVPWTAQP